MSADNAANRDNVVSLARTAGLDLSADDMSRLAMLYNHFAAARATLAGTVADEAEPVTIFQASEPDERR